MTVSLLEILAAARAHAAPLAAESAGYLLLAVADHVVAAPRVAGADEVELQADGTVRLRARRGGSSMDGAELGVRRLLSRALEVSSSVGPALRRAAERRESVGLEALVRELETALIPVNRSAARRALSRLHRETERARDRGKLEALLQAEPEPVALAADYPEAATPAPAPLPAVVASSMPVPAPAPALESDADSDLQSEPDPEPVRARPRAPAPPPILDLSPPPPPEDPIALTKPEPVVERARERGSSTPRLGTVITAQTLLGEEGERTERAPAVVLDEEQVALDEQDAELDVPIEVELPPDETAESVETADSAETAESVETAESTEMAEAAEMAEMAETTEESQPFVDPSPSRMPDVLLAMVELHTGIEADQAPTRLRDVITELRPPALTPEPELVEDSWLTHSSLEGIATAAGAFQVEVVDASVHEALTWNPGPVAPNAVEVIAAPEPEPAPALQPQSELEPEPEAATMTAPLPPALLITAPEPEPLAPTLLIAEPAPEPSPYAPAVLPGCTSDVSELLDSFHVSGAAEERELRGALKEIAGLDLTPMPHPLVEAE